MAMYYYSGKLNEASCSTSRCNLRLPPSPAEPAPSPPPPAPEQPAVVANPGLLRQANPLSYYDDDYYTMFQELRAIPALPFLACGDGSDIEYRNEEVATASLDTLVDMMRPSTSKIFKLSFLLCSRLFIKPHELLNKLCKKYFRNYDRLKEKGLVDVDVLCSEREDMAALVSLFTEWTIMFPYDFRDDRMMALVRIISERCSAEHMDTEVRIIMSSTLEKLLDKLTALEQYEETLTDVPQMSSVEHLATGDILTLGLTPIALAHQLSLLELHRLSFVGPEEFVQTFAPHVTSPSAAACSSTAIKLHHLESKCTRNLEAYADWFNRLSYLVATDVLKSSKSKYRARVIEQWIMTARECFNLGNFNSLMALISGLNMAPITRLKKTWARTAPVCGQQLRQLELCIEPTGNHARYRAALAAAPTATAVPLLSVTCRDLHFANQRAPSKLACNRINFEKWLVLGRHVDQQLAARNLTGPGAPPPAADQRHHAVWCFFNDTPTLTETAMELTSFEREAPVDNLEKERLKRLRMNS